jgi:hypothetical protein
MVQRAKSTNYFELFLRRNPGTVRVSTENSKDKVILVGCAIFRPAAAEFRLKLTLRTAERLQQS